MLLQLYIRLCCMVVMNAISGTLLLGFELEDWEVSLKVLPWLHLLIYGSVNIQ